MVGNLSMFSFVCIECQSVCCIVRRHHILTTSSSISNLYLSIDIFNHLSLCAGLSCSWIYRLCDPVPLPHPSPHPPLEFASKGPWNLEKTLKFSYNAVLKPWMYHLSNVISAIMNLKFTHGVGGSLPWCNHWILLETMEEGYSWIHINHLTVLKYCFVNLGM